LGETLTNQHEFHVEIRSRLNSGYACYYSVQIFVFPSYTKTPKVKNNKPVILPVVLYGCKTWYLTFREEHRLRACENRLLRKTFGPKRGEGGSWRKLPNDELRSLYFSTNNFKVIKSRRMRWAQHVARLGEGSCV